MRCRLLNKEHNLFRDCISIVDGTLFPLFQKPVGEPLDYFCYRKQQYGFQCIIICAEKHLMTQFIAGHPGSVHDSRSFQTMPVCVSPLDHFNAHEYILADSAYPSTLNTVTPFKRTSSPLTSNQKLYNKRLSSLRISVEHTIGILKGRFSSLKEVRFVLSTRSSYRCAIRG